MLAPAVRARYGLSLSEVGIFLAGGWVGTLLTLLAWGYAADRFGERTVLGAGLAGCAGFLVGAAYAPGFGWLVAFLGLAGAAGASVNAASGRAVMHWFGASQRGLALGIRQTAIPAGGLVAALSLPHLGVRSGFLFLAVFCLLGGVAGVLTVREPHEKQLPPEAVEWTLRDRRLWELSIGSGLYVAAQVALIGFVVLFLHDARGVSPGAAAGVLAAIQVVAAVFRIGSGRWSDLLGSRAVPLRRIGLATAGATGLVAALTSAPLWILVPLFVLAGGLSMAWNGLSFTAAAELAGGARSGAAIGFQQSVLAGVGVVAPVAFAALVASTSWRVGFALAAVCPLAAVPLFKRLT
ncbi:MAG: MFS transporter [Actinobacteria bacterium]|nr:MFS transporter [Actinomycetota bacterium]